MININTRTPARSNLKWLLPRILGAQTDNRYTDINAANGRKGIKYLILKGMVGLIGSMLTIENVNDTAKHKPTR
jgi:hypothetical protein